MKGRLRLTSGRKLLSPIGKKTRPTTSRIREAVMNIVSNRLTDCYWIDLFSGSGIMSCEALIRHAKKVVAIEKDFKTYKICKENILTTAGDLSNSIDIHVFNEDVLRWLKNDIRAENIWEGVEPSNQGFDIAYLDPPYDSKIYYSVLDALIKGGWLKSNSLVICEHSAELNLAPPCEWVEKSRKIYGSSALLLLSPL